MKKIAAFMQTWKHNPCVICYFPIYSNDVKHWLLNEIGIEDKDWMYDWGLSKIFFKHEEDKVKFILRWL